jgi:hypothetical protein
MAFWHVARGRAFAKTPDNAVDGSPRVLHPAGRARVGRGARERKCAIPNPSDRPDSTLPSLRKAVLESFAYEKTLNPA